MEPESREKIRYVIENPKGSYKSFEIENDPLWKDYPLAGVTYPVDYGYVEGYASEDGHDLDAFVGSGEKYGYFKMWRCDVPIETKIVARVTENEWQEILNVFRPVITESGLFTREAEFETFLGEFRRGGEPHP